MHSLYLLLHSREGWRKVRQTQFGVRVIMKSGDAICILTNNPHCDKARSRLGIMLGDKQAELLSRAFLFDVISSILMVPSIERYIAFWPPESQKDLTDFIDRFKIEEPNDKLAVDAACIKLIPQSGSGVNHRFISVSKNLFDSGIERALLICSENPLISPLIIKAALKLLRKNRAVLGPTIDGGFYLLGLDGHYPEIMDRIDWNRGGIYRQFRDRLDSLKIPWQELEVSYDIDGPDGLEQLYIDIDNLRLAGQGDLCRHTEKCLVNLKK